MTDDIISEEGRRARLEQWEQLGVDQVKADLQNGGHRVVGGPPPCAPSHGNGCA
jgi:hypothetical protein